MFPRINRLIFLVPTKELHFCCLQCRSDYSQNECVQAHGPLQSVLRRVQGDRDQMKVEGWGCSDRIKKQERDKGEMEGVREEETE